MQCHEITRADTGAGCDFEMCVLEMEAWTKHTSCCLGPNLMLVVNPPLQSDMVGLSNWRYFIFGWVGFVVKKNLSHGGYNVCCSVQGRRNLCKKLSQWQRNKRSWYYISINNSKKLKKQNQNHIHCERTAVKSSEHQTSSRSQRSSKETTTENKHISLYTTWKLLLHQHT